jgi:hypothetical protein
MAGMFKPDQTFFRPYPVIIFLHQGRRNVIVMSALCRDLGMLSVQ